MTYKQTKVLGSMCVEGQKTKVEGYSNFNTEEEKK
jgi:hypothetical protein